MIIEEAVRQGELLAEASPPGPHNPLVREVAPQPWPAPLDPEAEARRQQAARDVQRARRRFTELGSYEDPSSEPLLLDAHEIVAGWDADIDRLLVEAVESRSGDQLVELPHQLSTTAVLRLHADPDGFVAQLARPMPRQPSRSGTFSVPAFIIGWSAISAHGYHMVVWANSSFLILTSYPTVPTSAPMTSRNCGSSAMRSRPAGLAGRCRTRLKRRSASGSVAG